MIRKAEAIVNKKILRARGVVEHWVEHWVEH
jgi:hypothetical protein